MRRSLLQIVAVAFACALALPASGAAQRAKPPNPCLDPERRAQLNCPDLQMSKPFGLTLDPFVWPGHVVLRAGNSINSIGRGPAELFGIRDRRLGMRARQRIYRRDGGKIGIATGARLIFKAIPGQGSYWKYLYAAKFELFRRDGRGRRGDRARRGPKVSYCLRDLDRSRPSLPRSPRGFVYPGCNQSSRTRKVTLGTSVGWSDVYPPAYHEQWIDVTGLRGCFDFVHTADPRNGIYESNERNNSATVTVRLPFRPGPQRCPGRQSSLPRRAPDVPLDY
ncbi:MAG TPA: lysyl oxidase family protein [Thermoleophilaceae bacterium]|nr:lysyl oxidase family protein [Thermoleophilaceae bacterium]